SLTSIFDSRGASFARSAASVSHDPAISFQFFLCRGSVTWLAKLSALLPSRPGPNRSRRQSGSAGRQPDQKLNSGWTCWTGRLEASFRSNSEVGLHHTIIRHQFGGSG